MEAVTVKFEETFLHVIERIMRRNRYATKAEFIREAVRDKVKDLEKEEALLRLEKAYGAGAHKKRKITDKDVHKAGEEAVKEIAKELRVKLS